MGNVLGSGQDVNRDILQHKDFLREWMDPDFGLLSKLRARNALSEEEIDEIKDQRPYRKRNSKIIDHIIPKNKFKELIEALKDAKQTHVANYLIANGEYKPEFGGDWPLGEKEVSTMDANEECLVDLLETCDLLSRLLSTGVINKRQMEFISSKTTSFDKNEELIKLMRRFSLSSYWQTIKCLHATNQRHIAAIFENGGVLVRTDATIESVAVDVDETEAEIVTGITNILGDRSLPESNRILELVQLRLVGAKVGHSVDLYFHCLDLKDVDRLQEICENGHLKNISETVFKRLITSGGNIRVKVKWRADSFNRSRHFCKASETAQLVLEGGKTHRFPQIFPHETTMNNLPLELVDMILQKTYLCLVMIERQSPGCSQRQNLFSRMAKVDYCWFQRLRKRRVKRRLWRHLAAFYKDLDRFAVYRTNQKYFAETIQPTETVINRLRSADCLTDIEQRLIIRQRHRKDQRKRSKMEINAELLHVVRSFSNETRYSDFIGCLDESNQNVLTKFEQKGGATIKVKIVTEKWRKQKQLVQQFVQGLNDLENVTKPWPAELDKLMSQLNDDDIEILQSFPDRQAVVWIWSQSQIAFQNLRSLDEQHCLVKLLSCLSKTPQSATGTIHAQIKRHSIDIDIDQFKKAMVLFPVFVNFMSSLEVGEEEFVVGVTKLRTEIYILCGSNSSPNVIRVFQETEPFHPHGKIELKTVKFPEDIVSSEKENCLYVIDTWNQCVWKITKESDANYNFTNWLSTGIDWSCLLSLTRDDNLLIVRGCGPRSRLEVYGTDANLLLSIDLPPEIEFPQHAVETSTGHFVISHEWADESENTEDPIFKWEIWEVTRNGKMVIRRFSPQVLGQEILSAHYLLIDSDDRVLVADAATCRVTLLDSDLRWNRILIEDSRYQPYKMTYDEAKKQLVATGEYKGFCPKVYNFK